MRRGILVLCNAEHGVVGGGMSDLLAFDGVILVSEHEGSPRDAAHVDVI
jgi:hypothetical protein